MTERETQTTRDEAQIKFEQSGREGFVEDFIQTGVDDLRFMAMKPDDQEFWIELVESQPSLLDNLLFLD